MILLVFALAGLLHANDAGGGVAGVGANVTLATTSTTATLDNGVIQAVINKFSGKVTSYKLNGTQMVDPANPIYYSMDGGTSYEQPSNCVYSVVSSSPDQCGNLLQAHLERHLRLQASFRHRSPLRPPPGRYGVVCFRDPRPPRHLSGGLGGRVAHCLEAAARLHHIHLRARLRGRRPELGDAILL